MAPKKKTAQLHDGIRNSGRPGCVVSSLILFSFSAAKFGCRIALMMICGYGRVLTDGSTGFQGLPSHGREQLN